MTGTAGYIVAFGVALIGVAGSIGGVYFASKLNQVHTLVNATHTALNARIEQLETALTQQGIEIPRTTRETGKP